MEAPPRSPLVALSGACADTGVWLAVTVLILLVDSFRTSLERLLIADGGSDTLREATVELRLRLFFELRILLRLDLEELWRLERGCGGRNPGEAKTSSSSEDISESVDAGEGESSSSLSSSVHDSWTAILDNGEG